MIKLLIIAVSFLNPQVRDSVGIEIINGKTYVIHKVGEKETLYGISKRYGSTVDAVLQANPDAIDGLEIGEILKVPYTQRLVSTKNTGGSSSEVIHVVAEKETLFSISKAYGVTVYEIKLWNSITENALSLGQELIIKKRNTYSPPPAQPTQTPATNTTSNPDIRNKKTHMVSSKETMFSISKQYNVTVQQLRDWNRIQNNEISVGQVLFVAPPDQAIAERQNNQVNPPSPKVEEVKPSIITTNNQTTTETKQPETQPIVPVVKDTRQQAVKEQTITISEAVKGSDEILESGIGELIEGTDGNRKYLALHRTAPIGTILKVRNEMNNREVFVRVMGKLPDTALTGKLIIKVSKSAYDRLGAIDQRFRVQVTYYK